MWMGDGEVMGMVGRGVTAGQEGKAGGAGWSCDKVQRLANQTVVPGEVRIFLICGPIYDPNPYIMWLFV